jgi:hypothetical protein
MNSDYFKEAELKLQMQLIDQVNLVIEIQKEIKTLFFYAPVS